MQKITLASQLSEVREIGLRFFTKFKKLGIVTVKDLLWHFPARYEDWSELSSIADLNLGDLKTIRGVVKEIGAKRTWQKRMIIVEALIADESGSIRAIWFNQPYIKNVLKEGAMASFAGKVTVRKNELYLSNPTYEVITRTGADYTETSADDTFSQREFASSPRESTSLKHTGRLVPIYPETRGLTSKGIRLTVQKILENFESVTEFLPREILEENDLPEINEAIRRIHFPENTKEAENARRRFAFEELFLLQLNNLYQKIALAKEKAPIIKASADEIKSILSALPFELTDTQKQSLAEILRDLERSRPMNRLLQGDVGSGKTIVAGIAAMATANNGYQAALMAPTEILARQHYKTLIKLFNGANCGIGILVSKEARIFYGDELETGIKKVNFLKEIASEKVKIVVGTHALIEKNIEFKKLGLVVVDEQHRFGVKQRASLARRSSQIETQINAETINKPVVPHFLSMSATPIPRTIMMTVFGDLDLSIISELPKGRKNIVTKIVEPENRDKAYAFIRGQVRKGRQVFVVCPRIEPAGAETIITHQELVKLEIKSVKEEYDKLSKKVFPDLRVAMLHGKMKSALKEKTMSEFASGGTDILVSTSVVEVGVDVPNATIMMVEGSERFGLAQLYQFRGRVGRGIHQSFCFFFTESPTRQAHERLRSILTAKNGFELAEKDLKIRGPGEFLGKEQTGMPDIAMKALQNPELIKESRAAAESILRKDPNLKTLPNLKTRFREFRKEIHLE